MKVLFILLMLTQAYALAQLKIKKVLVEGEGLPIVMLAGGTADMSVFAVPAIELSSQHKVIRMEHFNVQYASDGLLLPNNYSVRMESEAIKYTLDSLAIKEPIVLVGHSYGGVIALDFALRYPTRIRSLVLIEPPVFSIAEAKNESPKGMKEMQDLLAKLTPHADITEDHVERFRCALMNCDSSSIRQLPQWTMWVVQKNRMRGLSVVNGFNLDLKKLHAFQKPVLMITGTRTAEFHKRINKLLTMEFTNAKEVSIQSGHAIPSTAPKELVKSLQEFIK